MERVAIYLRKSRADIELDNEEETLAKHKRTLLKYAKDKSLNIVRIYEEVVSGEKIANRPEMQSLLFDVQNKLYEAVLVMDMDRLGRGNMHEQGLIIDTFRESGTLIVTPRKTYDLRNEFDEEYSEFEAFFARKELKIITRRLQQGRTRSAQEGNFMATYAPFGYQAYKPSPTERTLVIDEKNAEIVRLIFDIYVKEQIGMNKMAKRLKELGVNDNGNPFTSWRVNQILKNEAYIGLIKWNRKRTRPHPDPEKKIKTLKRDANEVVLVKGKHPPIIDEKTFYEAQRVMSARQINSHKSNLALRNPLANLLKCGNCGKTMQRNCVSRNNVFVRCTTFGCKTAGSKLEVVETAVVDAMTKLMDAHKVELKDKPRVAESAERQKKLLHSSLKEWNELKRQKDNLHDLLEKGVYSVEMYLERSGLLAERVKEKEDALDKLRAEIERIDIEQKTRRDYLPALINVMKLYHKAKTVEQKNRLLKSVLHKIVYTKNKSENEVFFEVVLYPKI